MIYSFDSIEAANEICKKAGFRVKKTKWTAFVNFTRKRPGIQLVSAFAFFLSDFRNHEQYDKSSYNRDADNKK